MKEICIKSIKKSIKELFLNIGIHLDESAKQALIKAYKKECNPATRFALDIMIKNSDIAKRTNTPLCQDTGMAIVFADIGQDVRITGGSLNKAINEGVKEAYTEGFFRKSVLDPINRKNTKDNTPAVIHYNIVEGDTLTLSVMAKGFGSENMSRLFMLTPAEGVEGIKKAVIKTVKESGSNPCPPIVAGVGIGGTMEKAAVMSKRALLRDLNSDNQNPLLNDLENEIENEINKLNIGAQGLGGKVTALKVLIETFPTHIAGLPVAITIQCHAVRHAKIVL